MIKKEISVLNRYRKFDKKFTDSDLAEFDKEMQKFIVEKTFCNGEKIKVPDIDGWLEKVGATKNGKVMINGYQILTNKSGDPYVDCDRIFYEECMSKFDQWLKWKGRGEYVESKKMEQLDKIAQDILEKW